MRRTLKGEKWEEWCEGNKEKNLKEFREEDKEILREHWIKKKYITKVQWNPKQFKENNE